MIDCFDPKTGLPRETEQKSSEYKGPEHKEVSKVLDWPHIKQKGERTDIDFTPIVYNTISLLSNPACGMVFDASKAFLDYNKLGDCIYTNIAGVLVSAAEGKIELTQLLAAYERLKELTKEFTTSLKEEILLGSGDKCDLYFNAHYNIAKYNPWVSMEESAANKNSAIWLLKQLYKLTDDEIIRDTVEDEYVADKLIKLRGKIDVVGNRVGVKGSLDKDGYSITPPDQTITLSDLINEMEMLRKLPAAQKINWINSKNPGYTKDIKEHTKDIEGLKEKIEHLEQQKEATIGSVFFPSGLKQIYYQERDGAYDKLDDILEKNENAVIIGPPGQGKSTLACNYIKSKAKEGHLVRYIDASSKDSILAEFKSIANKYNLKIDGQQDTDIVEQVFTRLEHQIKEEDGKKAILCFDNVENKDDVQDYINRLTSNVKMVITTRDASGYYYDSRLKLGPFNKHESVTYLQKNLEKPFTEKSLEELIEAVGDKGNTMPYRMNKIVAWFNNKRKGATIDNYIKLYKEGKFDETETALLLELLKEQGFGKSWELLQYLAYLSPDLVTFDLIEMITGENDDDEFDNIIKNLEKLSLVETVNIGEADGVKTHSLTQKTVKSYANTHEGENMKNDNKQDLKIVGKDDILQKLIVIFDELMPKVGGIFNDNSFAAVQLYKHISSFIEEMNPDQIKDMEVKKALASLYEKLGMYKFHIAKDLEESMQDIKLALKLKNSIYGAEHIEIAETLVNASKIYRALEKEVSSLKSLDIAVAILSKIGGSPDVIQSDILKLYNKMHLAYSFMGQQQKSNNCFEKSSEILNEILEQQIEDLHFASDVSEVSNKFNIVLLDSYAENINELCVELASNAKYIEDAGRAKIALNLLESFIEASEKVALVTDEEHDSRDMVGAYSTAGLLSVVVGEDEQALEYIQKALELSEKLYGNDHHITAYMHQHVGDLYQKMGNEKEAKSQHDQVEISDKSYQDPFSQFDDLLNINTKQSDLAGNTEEGFDADLASAA